MATGVLDGKVAIVTGAAMGMGEATARVFAAAGAHVLVSDINPEAGEATVERITTAGGSASYCRTDVSSAADAEAMVRTAASWPSTSRASPCASSTRSYRCSSRATAGRSSTSAR